MFIISHCLFEQQRCSHNENPNNKCHPWGLLRVTYLLKHFSPCFDYAVLWLHCHEHNSVLLHTMFWKPQPSLRKPTWHLPLSILAVHRGFFFFFCHWIGICYFSPDDSIMHGLYFQCFAHWVRVRADALQSESIATMNWQYWCLIEPFQWSRRRNKQKQASVNCPGMNFPPFSPGFII